MLVACSLDDGSIKIKAIHLTSVLSDTADHHQEMNTDHWMEDKNLILQDFFKFVFTKAA